MTNKIDQRVESLIEYAEEVDRPEERYQLVKFELKQALTQTRLDLIEELEQGMGEEMKKNSFKYIGAIGYYNQQGYNTAHKKFKTLLKKYRT